MDPVTLTVTGNPATATLQSSLTAASSSASKSHMEKATDVPQCSQTPNVVQVDIGAIYFKAKSPADFLPQCTR